MIIKNSTCKLLLSASIISMSVFANSQAFAQCSTPATARCLDYQGNEVDDSACVNAGLTTPTSTCSVPCGGGEDDDDRMNNVEGNNGEVYGSVEEAEQYGGGVADYDVDEDITSVGDSSVVGGSGFGENTSDDGSSESDGGGYSCMVVTHFYKRGLFTKKEWFINKKDALSGRLSQKTIYGYHVWAPYAVLAMRERPWLEKIFFNLFMARGRVIEFEQGKRQSVSLVDMAARVLLETPSIVIGYLGFRPDHNYNYNRIYNTYQDVKLSYNQVYVRQPQGMIGW